MLYESAECGLRDVFTLWMDFIEWFVDRCGCERDVFFIRDSETWAVWQSHWFRGRHTHTQTPAAAERTMNFSMSWFIHKDRWGSTPLYHIRQYLKYCHVVRNADKLCHTQHVCGCMLVCVKMCTCCVMFRRLDVRPWVSEYCKHCHFQFWLSGLTCQLLSQLAYKHTIPAVYSMYTVHSLLFYAYR